MSIDLTKLSPAPWFADESYVVIGRDKYGEQVAKFDGPVSVHGDRNDNAAFCALARNAFDVMMRRGWVATHNRGVWKACFSGTFTCPWKQFGKWEDTPTYPDPFTALVEADRWFSEHVENGVTLPYAGCGGKV